MAPRTDTKTDGGGSADFDWLRDWMRRTAAAHDLSWYAWAAKADVAPSTLTRFMASTHAPALALRTIMMLARAIGEPVPPMPGQRIPQRLIDVPLLSPRLIRAAGSVGEARDLATGVVAAEERHQDCSAIRATEGGPRTSGVLPGDLLLFDPQAVPANGDLAVVLTAADEVGVLRLFDVGEGEGEGGAGGRGMADGLPQPLSLDTVMVLGIARRVQRELR